MGNSHIESRTRQTDRVYREILDKDRAAVSAKTARLRALRLAKEAEAGSLEPLATPVVNKRPRRRSS